MPPPAFTAAPAPTPAPSEPSPIDESREIKGHLSTAVIQRVVRANMSRMSACYEAALARNQNAPGGKVRVRDGVHVQLGDVSDLYAEAFAALEMEG